MAVRFSGCGLDDLTGSLTLLVLEREAQAAAFCEWNSPLGDVTHIKQVCLFVSLQGVEV